MTFNRVFGDANLFQQEAKVITVEKREQRKPDKIVEKVRKNLHNGHKLYECDHRNGILEEVKYRSKVVHSQTGLEEFVYMEKNWCVYIPALNETNAMRKFKKLMAKALKINVTEQI